MCAVALRGQKKALTPLGDRITGSCDLLNMVLGTKLGSFALAVSAFNQ